MQKSYFLGASGPDGFHTDFICEYASYYGVLLKGGPGTGKSTLMKKVVEAFKDEDISIYHCASDPHSLDAVVLEERGVYVMDATAPHVSETPLPFVTGEVVNLASELYDKMIDCNEVRRLYEENRNKHIMAQKGVSGISAAEEMIVRIGQNALLIDKINQFAERFAKKIIHSDGGHSCSFRSRQMSAITPEGEITLFPPEWKRIEIVDPYFAASQFLLKKTAGYAAENGACCEIGYSLIQHDHPITSLLLHSEKTGMLSVQDNRISSDSLPVQIINTGRFYDRSLLRNHRSMLRFCIKERKEFAEKATEILAEALQIHDRLEAQYIAAQNTDYLAKITDYVLSRLRSFPHVIA